MGFDEKDTTEQLERTTRPVQVRLERAAPAVIEEAVFEGEGEKREEVTPVVYGPPVAVYVVLEVDGHAEHRRVDDEAVAAAWDGPKHKTLKEWVLAIIDEVE